MTEVSKEAVEALADAWASIDGNKAVRDKERELDVDIHGFLGGYTDDAAEMIARLETRGFTITSADQSAETEGIRHSAVADYLLDHKGLRPAMTDAELLLNCQSLAMEFADDNMRKECELAAFELVKKYRGM